MKFEKLGKERENVILEIDPFVFGENNIIKDMDNTLGYIKKNKPKIQQEYVAKLMIKLQEISEKNDFKDKEGKLANHIQKYEHLLDQYDLMKLLFGYFIKTLGITEQQLWENKKRDFLDWNFFHSIRDLQLIDIKTLIAVLGKEEAMKFYKKIVDSYIKTHDQNQKGWYKDLEEMRFHHSKFMEKNTFGRVRLLSEVKDGRYIEICLTCDKVRNYPNTSAEDRELLDVTGCYCHHALTQLWNDNFKLTLNNTIAKGDPYCTYVYHDTRIVDKIEEPTKEFFDGVVAKHK